MNALKILLVSTILCSAIIYGQNNNHPSVPVTQPVPLPQNFDSLLFCNQLDTAATNVQLTDLFSNPSSFEGKTINVKGNITDICQEAGCWTYISDGTNYLLVQTLHKFFLPKEVTGKISTDGIFKFIDISEEHARAMLKESRNPRMKEEDIKGPQKVYVLEATGIMVFAK